MITGQRKRGRRATPHMALPLAHMPWVALLALAQDCLHTPREQGMVLITVLMRHCMPGQTHSSWRVQGLKLARAVEVLPAPVLLLELGPVHKLPERCGWA